MKLFLSILFFFFLGNLFSQNEIAFKSKVKESEILLRWTPIQSDLMPLAFKNGFTLSRKEWNGNGNPPPSFWDSNLDFSKTVTIPDKNDSIWKVYFKKNNETGILHSYFFPEKETTKIIEENLFGLTLLTCDLHPDLAQLAGLYFKDSTFEKGKTYAYKIEINSVKKSGVVIVKSDLITSLPKVNDFDLKSVNETVEISWNFRNYQTDYSGYFIERSTDSIHFEKLNSIAFIPMASQYEKNKEIIFYSDSSVKEGLMYWYRLSGQDHFGEKGLSSPSKKIFVSPVFKGELVIDTLFELKHNLASVKWKFSHETDRNITKTIQILRSETINGKYQLLKEMNSNVSEFEFELKERENYIKIIAINEASTGSPSKMESWPSLLLIPDRFPPAIPDSIIGKIDRNGKVTLSWKNNLEKDLRGYRVFRTNALREEMIEVSKNFIRTNSFEDSTDIKSLTEEIYYSVNAVDSTYNNSKLSFPIKLMKPDYIPPVAAPIIGISANEKGNFINWVHSTSRDVAKTELRRSKDGKTFEMVYSSQDSTSQFLDTLIENESGFYYRTIVIDDANNFAESESIYLYNSKFKVEMNDSISVTINREKKFIELKWIPLKQEVYSYTIYKAKKGEVLRSFKTVNGNILEIKDDELYISNEYIYAIKAVLKSGREVMVNSNIPVVY